jgi:hypothetical protein
MDARRSHQLIESDRQIPRPRCDCAVTSAVRGGVSDHPGIPTGLKTQLLRPNWTELNRLPSGSIPVSATNSSTTYRECAVTRCDAQRTSRKPGLYGARLHGPALRQKRGQSRSRLHQPEIETRSSTFGSSRSSVALSRARFQRTPEKYGRGHKSLSGARMQG